MKQRLYISLFLIFLYCKSLSQGYIISQPRLEADGNQLLIFYDIITKHSSDQFYVWIEIRKSNGEILQAKTLNGDIGGNVKAGSNRKITWSPEQDSIYLDEEIFVEIKSEKQVKEFNKSSMMLKSAAFPGWGQTNISKGKPWWLMGVAVYGTLAGGYVYHKKYLASNESYKAEEDPLIRADLLDQAQKQLNISTAMIYSSISAWALNVLWVALIPDPYLPHQHIKFSLNSIPDINNGGVSLSLRLAF